MESPEANEFATEPVPATHQVGWLRVGVVSAMVSFSLPTFVTGGEVYRAVGADAGPVAILIGCAVLTVIGALCGAIGTRTHLSSYMLVRIAFGTRGAALVNLAFAVSLLGWFGVNIDLFAGALDGLARDALGWSVPNWAAEVFAGVTMTATTIYGFRAINNLSALLVPAMMVVTAVLAARSLGVEDPTVEVSAAALTFGDAISAVVGGVIVGAVILPDVTRFIRHWSGAAYTAVLSYGVVQALVMVTGGAAALATGEADFLQVLVAMGLSWGAFVLVIAGSWVLNSLNLYSTVLSVEATAPRAGSRLGVVVLGALGTVAAFMNVLDYFLTFLFYLAIVFVPVAGVIVIDFLLLRRRLYLEDFAIGQQAWVPAAVLAWVAGSVVALLGSEGVIRLSGVAALDAMVVAAVAYYGLHALLPSGAARAAT